MKLHILLLLALFVLASCDNSQPEPISKRQLRTLMLDSITHSAESWWYLGSDAHSHYILIERPGTSDLYSVLSEKVTIKLERFQYIANSNKRAKLKLRNIKLRKRKR